MFELFLINFEIGYGFQNAPKCNGLTKLFLYKKILMTSKVILFLTVTGLS